MARKTETNSVTDHLKRLFGHDADRSLIAKLAGEDWSPLKKHQLAPDSGSISLKPSTACDNLIKNLVALTNAFNSPKLACDLANGQVSKATLHREIEDARKRLEKKLKAYGYWFNRLHSLETILNEKPSLEEFALEDKLLVDSHGKAGQGEPYALRAVQLLEKVEEQGRSSLLSLEQMNEKAWALYRLGLSDQAVSVARQVVRADPEHPESWMLLAIHSISQLRSARQESAYYELQHDEAEPMSAHENWAGEMQGLAEEQVSKALADHRTVVFTALLYWPKDEQSRYGSYRYSEIYEQMRTWCIDWLFQLLQPNVNDVLNRVNLQLVYQANGLAPEFAWNAKLPSLCFEQCDRPHALSELQMQAAEKISREWDELIEPSEFFSKLKMLHIQFVLGFSGYEALHQRILRDLKKLRWNDLLLILQKPSLLQALTTHCAGSGVDELWSHFEGLAEQVEKEQRESFVLLKANLLSMAYHHAFLRDQFAGCLRMAREAQTLMEASPDYAPPKLGPTEENETTYLKPKYWKYLELRAALEIATESEEAQQTLLSVAQPGSYFANEADYLILSREWVDELNTAEYWYFAPYGQSILSSGRWLQMLEKLMAAGIYSSGGPETESRVRELMVQLAPLVEKCGECS